MLWTDDPAGGRSPVPYQDVQTGFLLETWQPVRRYFELAGDQTLDPATGDVLETACCAGDLIDSTMAATDATGFAIDYAGGTDFQPAAYSAFGEVLDASGTPGGSAPAGFPRYQYARGWGYELDLLALPAPTPASRRSPSSSSTGAGTTRRSAASCSRIRRVSVQRCHHSSTRSLGLSVLLIPRASRESSLTIRFASLERSTATATRKSAFTYLA